MLYKILNISHDTDEKISANFILDPQHAVFKGHFPEQPILPGVVMIQIQKDILQQHNHFSIALKSASNIKYLLPIIPVENKLLTFNIRYKILPENLLSVNGELIQEGTICMKFSGIYVIK